MKKLILLTRHPELPTVSAFSRAANELTIPACVLLPDKLRIIREKPSGATASLSLHTAERRRVEPPGLVLPRVGSTTDEYTISVVLALEQAGFTVVNRAHSLSRVRNKPNALVELAGAGLPTLPFAYLRFPQQLSAQIRRIGGLPVMVKFIRGSQGLGVMKVNDLGTASALVNSFNTLGYDVYIEKCVSRREKQDLRFIVVRGEFLAAMKRRPARNDYRANVHRGGHTLPHTATAEETQLAEKVARFFKLGLAGVDLLRTRTGLVVLEVNSSPGLEGISDATGRDLAKEVLLEFYPRLKRRHSPPG